MTSQNTSLSARFTARLRDALSAGNFRRLRLVAKAGRPVEVRRVELKSGPALSFALPGERGEVTRNLPVDEGLAEVGRRLDGGDSAWLETDLASWQFVADSRRPRLVRHAVAKGGAAPVEHDRRKDRWMDDARAWLQPLGLLDAGGKPAMGRRDKLRQIERYADLLSHFVADAGWKTGNTVHLVDMGCGRGYLTFAAWHLLVRGLGLDARVIGVDRRADLVEEANQLAGRIGATSLSFRTGDIATAPLDRVDVLIALHACNDATDQALRRGVGAGAKLILLAPCCHKDLRRELGVPAPLGPILKHGLFKERFAEWLTDGLRVLELESAGYRVKTAEFVDAEHTPRNVLIGAVQGTTENRREKAAAEMAELRAWALTSPPAATQTAAPSRKAIPEPGT